MRSIRYWNLEHGRRAKRSALVKETGVESYLAWLRKNKQGFQLIEVVEVNNGR